MVLSITDKAKAVAFKQAGWNITKIAKELKVSRQTIYKAIADYKQHGHHERKEGSGRCRKLNERDERALIREIKKDSRIPLSDIVQRSGLDVSIQTVRRSLERAGFKSRVVKKSRS